MKTSRLRAQNKLIRRPSPIERLENRLLLTTVSFTGGGDGVSWTDPNNWSTGQLPQPADDVVISQSDNRVITLASGAQNVNSIITLNEIDITGGSLSVATTLDTSFFLSTRNGGVALDGGTLSNTHVTGAGFVNLDSGFLVAATLDVNAYAYQAQDGSGAYAHVENGLTLNSTLQVGYFPIGAPGRTAVPQSTPRKVVVPNGLSFVGVQTLSGTGQVLMVNNPQIQLDPGHIIILRRIITVPANLKVAAGMTIHGTGTITDLPGGVAATLDNQGSIVADQQQQLLQVTAENIINESPGSMTEANGGILAVNSDGDNQGSLTISSGTVVVDGNPATFQTLNLIGGTLTGNATVNLTGPNSTWSGGTMTGAGLTDIKPGAALTTTGAGLVSTRAFNNEGTVNLNAGTLDLLGTGSHSGTFNVAANTTLTFGGLSSSQFFSNTSSLLGAGNLVFSGSSAFIGGVLNIGTARITALDAVQFGGPSPTVGTLTQDGGRATVGLFTLIPIKTAPAANTLHVLHQHIISNGIMTVLPNWAVDDDGDGLLMLPSAAGTPGIVLSPDSANPGVLMFSGTAGVTCTGSGGGSITSTAPAGLQRGYIDLNGNRSFTIGSAGASLMISASLGDGSVRSAGPGVLQLAAPNTFAGGTAIASSAAGLLEIDDPAALGSGPVTFAGGDLSVRTPSDVAFHNVFAPDVPADGIRINVGSVKVTVDGITAGSFLGVSGNPLLGSLTVNGAVTLQSDLVLSNPVPVTLNGAVSGPHGLTKTGGGPLVLAGSTGNVYTGPTEVIEGALVLQKAAGLAVPGTLLISPDIAGGAAVRSRASNQLPTTMTVAFDSTVGPAVLDFTGATQTLAGLTSKVGRFGSLTLGTGGKLSLTAPSSTLHDLNITGGGKLDIGSGSLSLAYGSGTSPLGSIRLFLSLGGITAGSKTVAYTDGSEGVLPAVQAGTVLLKGTVAGDVNMDGTVGFADLLLLAQHYNKLNATWVKGDVDYSGQVAFADLLILAQHYGQHSAAAAVDAAAKVRRSA